MPFVRGLAVGRPMVPLALFLARRLWPLPRLAQVLGEAGGTIPSTRAKSNNGGDTRSTDTRSAASAGDKPPEIACSPGASLEPPTAFASASFTFSMSDK